MVTNLFSSGPSVLESPAEKHSKTDLASARVLGVISNVCSGHRRKEQNAPYVLSKPVYRAVFQKHIMV